MIYNMISLTTIALFFISIEVIILAFKYFYLRKDLELYNEFSNKFFQMASKNAAHINELLDLYDKLKNHHAETTAELKTEIYEQYKYFRNRK